jgi:F0F1-type ATP synthase membrane subunit c/vacuolar-type H+-ATPase subunit K
MIIAINASAKECRDAKIAQELFTINTVIVHLFLTLGLIKLLIGLCFLFSSDFTGIDYLNRYTYKHGWC